MKQLAKKSLEVLLSLKEWKYIDQLFLIPITMWTTIETAFFTAQFTRVNTLLFNGLISFIFLLLIGFYNLFSRYPVRLREKESNYKLNDSLIFSYVGIVMVCAGVFQAVSSYVFGRLVKYTGRIVVFGIAAMINYAMIILMLLWDPEESQMFVLFIIAALWSISDAVWQTQVICNSIQIQFTIDRISVLF